MNPRQPGVWFPAIRCGTGADVWTSTLVNALQRRGWRADVTWLPHRAEYAPWSVPAPRAPSWATIAHVNTWLPPRLLPRGMPIVATMHHCVHDPAYAPYVSPLQALYHRTWILHVERSVLRRAQGASAVSAYTASRAAGVFADVDWQVILNGLDPQGPFVPPAQREPRDGPFRLLYVGSWSRRKGVDLLEPIMRELGDGYVLHHTGRPLHPGIPGMVSLGRLPDVASLVAQYHEADALLMPSRLEGFGLVALEAMACGLPVVATRGSALVEVVDDGVTGLLCPADDVHAFAGAIRELAASAQRRRAMGSAGRHRAEREFSLDRMVDGHVDMYRRVLEGCAGA